MATKPDISTNQLLPWNEYKDKTADAALASIYTRVSDASKVFCTWYWASIHAKRRMSLWVRGIAFLLLVLGTTFPIYAAIENAPHDRLWFTQYAVAFLAAAGLTQVADKIFGWSSGWMRYITTVTTIENLTRSFELEWAKYIVSRSTQLDSADVKALFELARGFEHELTRLQGDETAKWVAEFNTGISLLESLIRTQREETDKKLDAIRTSLSTQKSADKAAENARLPGAIEVTLVHKTDPKKVRISMGEDAPVEFLGYVWTKLNVAPGLNVLAIQTLSEPRQTIQKVVDVNPSEIARIEVKLPA